MEKKIYTNNFEQFLRETTDDFRMIPSPKVWYSIYNNMHPDRKWPSVAICLIILSAVLYIGVSNNNSISNDLAHRNIAQNSGVIKTPVTDRSALAKQSSRTVTQTNAFAPSSVLTDQTGMNGVDRNTTNTFPADEASVNENSTARSLSLLTAASRFRSLIASAEATTGEETEISVKTNLPGKDISSINPITTPVIALNNKAAEKPVTKNTIAKLPVLKPEEVSEKTAENKIKNRSSLSYYLTPSVGYRNLTKIRDNPPANSASASRTVNNNVATPSGILKDNKALNLELGAIIEYSVAKKIRVSSGLQVNYTNYTSDVTGFDHPIQAALSVKDYPVKYGSSVFSSVPGSDRLNKSTLQISIPMGADIKLLEAGKIKWYIGGALQPSYVFGGSAYILSSDAKNYIQESSLLRKMNLNTSLETYISFKTSSGVSLNLGPQIRYQLLSTYKKQYNYTEKLYNVGIKIGLTTGL